MHENPEERGTQCHFRSPKLFLLNKICLNWIKEEANGKTEWMGKSGEE